MLPNIDYLKSQRGKITCAETAFALIGGVLNATHKCKGDIFLGFVFWMTFITSGTVFFLNLFGLWKKLMERHGYEIIYGKLYDLEKWFNILNVCSRIFSYGICAFISFFPLYWSVANIVGYIEMLLFSMEGWILYKTKTVKPEDIRVLTDYPITEYDE